MIKKQIDISLSEILNSNNYQLELIDYGSFGVIEKLIDNSTNNIYAIKTISFEKFTKTNNVIGHNRLYFMVINEIEVMNKLNELDCFMFPKLYDYNIIRKNERMIDKIVILMEYIHGKTLKLFLNDLIKLDSEQMRQTIITISISILKSIKLLHQNGIIHKDLKLENVMINFDITTIQSTFVYLIDFGLSCIDPKLKIHKDNTVNSRIDYWNEMQGTPFYISPQLIKLNSHICGKIDSINLNINNFDQSKIYDIWSFGIILHYLVYRCFPFTGKTVNELFNQIKNCNKLILVDIKPYSDIINIISNILTNLNEQSNVDNLIESFTQIHNNDCNLLMNIKDGNDDINTR